MKSKLLPLGVLISSLAGVSAMAILTAKLLMLPVKSPIVRPVR